MTEYNVVMIDPPWNEQGGGKCKRGADKHYPLMKTPEIIRTLNEECEPLKQMSDTSLCYLWVTNNYLPDGLRVMEAIGYKYITNIVWTKSGNIGMGYYYRGQHELCLFGRRKAPGRPKGTTTSWLGREGIPRREHSRKPEQIFEMIESQWDGPYLELFARQERDGWDAWGNEVGDD